jgi:hypothetical protein
VVAGARGGERQETRLVHPSHLVQWTAQSKELQDDHGKRLSPSHRQGNYDNYNNYG